MIEPLPGLRDGAPLVFDLDGTINDSRPAIRHAGLAASRRVMGHPLDLDALVREISRGVPACMQRLCPSRADELTEAFVDEFVPVFAPMAHAYPGMPILLEHAHTRHPIAIVTSNVREAVELVEDELGIRRLADAVVTASEGHRPKPDPEPVIAALELLGTPEDGGVMIGDSPYDVSAGRAAGLDTVAVSWGLVPVALLEDARPDSISHSPADLEAVLGLSDH